MMHSIIFALLFLWDADALLGNKIAGYCKQGSTSKINEADCDKLGKSGMQQCLATTNHDNTIAAIIYRCEHLLPSGSEFDNALQRSLVNGQKQTFRALVSHGRCANASRDAIKTVAKSAIQNNYRPFIVALVRHCLIDEKDMNEFKQQALIQGHGELLQAMEQTPRAPSVVDPTGVREDAAQNEAFDPVQMDMKMANTDPGQSFPGRRFPSETRNGRTPSYFNSNNRSRMRPSSSFMGSQNSFMVSPSSMGGNQQQSGYSNSGFGSSYFPNSRSSFSSSYGGYRMGKGHLRGNVRNMTSQEVSQNISILSQLTPAQARDFGLLNDACIGLTEAHFRQPNVSTLVVGNLPLNCFQNIQGSAFAGLNAGMVQRIKWWSFVNRDQIKYIPPNDAIRALPFDQLGPGRQKDREDRIHPCWAITKDQMRAIKNNSKVRKEYNRRCVRSEANKMNIPLSMLMLTLSSLIIQAFVII